TKVQRFGRLASMNIRPPASRPHKSPVHTVKELCGAKPSGFASRDISSREPPIVANLPGLSTILEENFLALERRESTFSSRAAKNSVIGSGLEEIARKPRYTEAFRDRRFPGCAPFRGCFRPSWLRCWRAPRVPPRPLRLTVPT